MEINKQTYYTLLIKTCVGVYGVGVCTEPLERYLIFVLLLHGTFCDYLIIINLKASERYHKVASD